MKFVFLFSPSHNRSRPWDGSRIRHGGVGVSGSEQTFVIWAESFAAKGHEVVGLGEFVNPSFVNGVVYDNVWSPKLADADVIFVHDFNDDFSHFPFHSGVRYLCVNFACQVFACHNRVLEFVRTRPHVRVIGVYPSEWSRQAMYTKSFQGSRPGILAEEYVVSNPIMMDLIPNAMPPRVPRSFVWLASWERGGHVALRVFKGVKNHSVFNIMTYVTNEFHELDSVQDDRIHVLKSSDKSTVFHEIARSDYFVYPLVLPNGLVHKDTFACCVAEALALGAIVITWDVAALREIYGDHILYVPFPEGADVPGLQSETVAIDMHLASDESVRSMVDMIEHLEAHPDQKEAIRSKGMQFSRSVFDPAFACLPFNNLVGS